jgi:hypothetical protein
MEVMIPNDVDVLAMVMEEVMFIPCIFGIYNA